MTARIDDKKMILVVDDDAICREGLGIILERAGYQVRVARDGLEALGCAHEGPAPDLILLDLTLPIENCGRVLRRWRQNPTLAARPVVIVTALDACTPAWAASQGAAGCLRKPVAIESLLAEVRRCCR